MLQAECVSPTFLHLSPLSMAILGDKAFMEVMKIEEGHNSKTLCEETSVLNT